MSRVQSPIGRGVKSKAVAPTCAWGQNVSNGCSNKTWHPSGFCWVHQGRDSNPMEDRIVRRHTSDSVLSSRRSRGWSQNRDASIHLLRERPALFMSDGNNPSNPWYMSHSNTTEVLWNDTMVSLPYDDETVSIRHNKLKGGAAVEITPRGGINEEFFRNAYDMSKDLYSNVYSYESGLMDPNMSESYPNDIEALASLNIGQSQNLRVAYLPSVDGQGEETMRIKDASGRAVTMTMGRSHLGVTRTSHLAWAYEVKGIKSSDYENHQMPPEVVQTAGVVLEMRAKVEALSFRNSRDGSTMIPFGWQGEEPPAVTTVLASPR